MIERFNFYDIYGYLIPGFVWLMLLALPVHFIVQFQSFGAAELTAALVAGYVAGHVLSGMARDVFPSERFSIGKQDPVYRSVAVLVDGYSGKDALPDGFKKQLRARFEGQFGFDPFLKLDPAKPTFDTKEAEQMFFLCRAALSHAKLGAYVEQYQGMMTLTRSLALGFRFVAIYYAGWILGSAPRHGASGLWPVVTLILAIVVADGVQRIVQPEPLPPPDSETEQQTRKRAAAALKRNIEWQTMSGVLAFAGVTLALFWYPLTNVQSHALAAGVGVAWICGLRFRNASEALDGSLVSSVYRDFVTMASARDADKKMPLCKPDDD